MFGIRWSISYIAILSFQPSVDAFLVQSSYSSITPQQPCRNPLMTPMVSKQVALRNPQPSFVANPIGTATEGVQSSLGKVWSTLFGLLLPFREAAVPLAALAMSNEWQVNLVKHVLTLISIRFVLSTIADYQRQTSFRWRKLPRYLLASGLIALGGVWIDSVVVIPYYGINLMKHVASMFVCIRAVSLVRSRRKISEPIQELVRKPDQPSPKVISKKALSSSSPPVPAPPPPPVPLQVPQVAVEEKGEAVVTVERMDEAKTKKEKILMKQETPIVTEEQTDDQVTMEENGKEKDGSKDDSETNAKVIDESFKEWFHSLANIQDELAEIQLKAIPEIFSKETYDRAQEKITKFQMGKVLDFFRDDD